MLVEHLVAHVEGFQKHQSQEHAQIAFQLGVVDAFLPADCEEGFYSFYEVYYHFVVDVVELPDLAIGVVSVVGVLQGMLLNVIDVQLFPQEF